MMDTRLARSRPRAHAHLLFVSGLLSCIAPWSAHAAQENTADSAVNATTTRALTAPANHPATKSEPPSVDSLLQSKPVHGPLTLPNSDEQATLGFYQQGNQVYALYSRPDYQDESQTYHDLIDSFTDAHITAVFFQDLDGGDNNEVVVMYKDKQGQHLRAYAMMNGSYIPLNAMQSKLNALAPSIQPFTVAASRKALRTLQPQDYRISYDLPADSPSDIKALLRGELQSPAQPAGYLDEQGYPVDKAAIATFAITRYPALTRSVTTADGRVLTYVLTQILARNGGCQGEDYSFNTLKIGYMRADLPPAIFDYDDEASLINHPPSPKPEYDGPYLQFSVTNCYAMPQEYGNYVQGKQQGRWESVYPDEGILQSGGNYVDGQRQGTWTEWDGASNNNWHGQYKDNFKEGLWLLTTDSQPPVVLARENYRHGLRNGPAERYTQLAEDDAPSSANSANALRLIYKGEYRDEKKVGHWIETVDGKRQESNYQDDVLHGVQKKYNADNVLIQQSTYQHGQLQGETRRFYSSGQLLQITNYQQGQPVGEEFYFYDGQVKTGPLRSWQNWKLIKPADPNAHCNPQDEEECTPAGKPRPVSILFGEQREYAENGRLTSLSYQAGETKEGNAYRFNDRGQLYDVSAYYHGKQQGLSSGYNVDKKEPRLVRVMSQWDNRISGVSYGFDSNKNSLRYIGQACQKPDETYAGQPYLWDNAGASCGSQFTFHPNGQVERITWKDSGWDITEVVYGKSGDLGFELRYAGNNVFFKNRYMTGSKSESIWITKLTSPKTRTEKGRTFSIPVNSDSDGIGYKKYYTDGRLLDESIFNGTDHHCWRRYAKDGSIENSNNKCDGVPPLTTNPAETANSAEASVSQ